MKALTLTGIGGLEHLAMLEVPPPALRADDDVLIRVRCAALNRIDLWMTGGLPNVKPAFPHVVGSDGAGEVEAVGPGVRRLAPRRPGADQSRDFVRSLRGLRGG